MAELDEIRQSLLLAKEALRAPAAARARLRTQLVANGTWPAASEAPGDTAPNALSANDAALRFPARSALHPLARQTALRFSAVLKHPVAAWAAALLLGVGFGAGYWVGHSERTLAGTVSTPGTATALDAPKRTPSLAPVASTSRASNQASTLDQAALDDSTLRNTVPGDTALGGPALEERPTPGSAAVPRAATTAAKTPAGTVTKPLPRSSRHAPRVNGTRAFAAELALVQRAERAIRAGDPELALSLLADLDRDFPTPALREERRAARLLAECERAAKGTGLSTESEPRNHAQQFLTEQPGSVYSDRIRKICALDGSAALSKPSSEGSDDPGH